MLPFITEARGRNLCQEPRRVEGKLFFLPYKDLETVASPDVSVDQPSLFSFQEIRKWWFTWSHHSQSSTWNCWLCCRLPFSRKVFQGPPKWPVCIVCALTGSWTTPFPKAPDLGSSLNSTSVFPCDLSHGQLPFWASVFFKSSMKVSTSPNSPGHCKGQITGAVCKL